MKADTSELKINFEIVCLSESVSKKASKRIKIRSIEITNNCGQLQLFGIQTSLAKYISILNYSST